MLFRRRYSKENMGAKTTCNLMGRVGSLSGCYITFLWPDGRNRWGGIAFVRVRRCGAMVWPTMTKKAGSDPGEESKKK